MPLSHSTLQSNGYPKANQSSIDACRRDPSIYHKNFRIIYECKAELGIKIFSGFRASGSEFRVKTTGIEVGVGIGIGFCRTIALHSDSGRRTSPGEGCEYILPPATADERN